MTSRRSDRRQNNMSDTPNQQPLVEEAEAARRMLDAVQVSSSERLPVCSASGYAAESVAAELPSPPFDCSSMDGYALGGSGPWPAGLEVELLSGEVAAGDAIEHDLPEGRALRIFTGAPVPVNCGAVVMQEDVEIIPGTPEKIRIGEAVEPGEFIRRAGADLCRGQIYLQAGQRISPQVVAALTSQGRTEVLVHQVPRVGILTTGDELVAANIGIENLKPGQIFNSNRPLIDGLCRQAGAEIVVAEHVGDSRDDLFAVATRMVEAGCHIIISTGGVSVGDHDHVRWLVDEMGLKTHVWKIRMQPGKPMLFAGPIEGVLDSGPWFFGLPGNPASAFVCFHRFVAPAIRKRAGADQSLIPVPSQPATAAEAFRNRGNRPHYLRGHLDRQTATFRPLGLQQSHAIAGLASADALVRLEPSQEVAEGDSLEVFPV